MRLFLLINIIQIISSFYMNPIFIYYKNRITLACSNNINSNDAYNKLLIELNKLKAQEVEREKNKRQNKKGLNLTEIRNFVNNSSKSRRDYTDNLDYLNNDDENPFWYEY